MRSAVLLSTLFVFWDVVGAFRLPVAGNIGKRQPRNIERRDSNVVGTAALTDTSDVQYSANITLGGLPFSVLIDTGSADLWVASANPIPGAVDSGATASVQYAVGAVEGPIEMASLVFAGHTVPHQAFIFVTPDQGNVDGTGLIGLGPSSGSNILSTLNSAAGNTPLDSIFLLDLTTPNFLSILLGRADEPGAPFPGDITVGEILPGYENVTSQPQLNVTEVSLSEAGNQHWQALLDADGCIGPDGHPIPVSTVVEGAPNPDQLTAVFDSGFSLPQVPKGVADAFYGSFTGAEYVNITGVGGIWSLPCTTEVNIAFQLGGIKYPVHPLDAVLEPADLGLNPVKNAAGQDMCLGSFQPISFDSGGILDMILGMAFLRNTYAVFNFGDFILGTQNRASPYVQLLSTTNDSAKAHNDFVTVRGGSTTGRTQGATSGNSSGGSRSSSSSNSSNFFKTHAKLFYIIGASILGALALGLVAFFMCCRSRKSPPKTVFAPYAPLNAPAPAPATDMHMQPAWNNQQYNQPYHQQQQYSEPWGPRY